MKTLILAALTVFAAPCVAADLPATPATYPAVLASAKCGDTLRLAPGAYPALLIAGRVCTAVAPLAIVGDPAAPAVFPTATIKASAYVAVDGPTVDFQPDAKTVSFSPAVKVDGSNHVVLTGMKVIGHDAVAGVSPDALQGDATGAVIGYPVGYGVQIVNSQDVSFTYSEIAGFDRQMALANLVRVTIDHNWLHDRRHTAIVGGGFKDVTISNNLIHGSRPWRLGQTPYGDHSDVMAFWSAANATTPNDNLAIVGNRMVEVRPPSSMGIWFQGTLNAPFTNLTVERNLIAVANLQGIALWNVQGGSIRDNDLVTVQMAGIEVAKQRPTALLLDGVSGVTVERNRLGVAPADRTGKNTLGQNTITSGAISAP